MPKNAANANKPRTKWHGYTVSPAAKHTLYKLFELALQPHRTTTARRNPTMMVDALGAVVPEAPSPSQQHVEGLSHALIQLHRSYDLYDYFPKPAVPMYLTTPGTQALFYNPPDLPYLEEAAQDDTPEWELPAWERQQRLDEYRRIRGWRPDGKKRSALWLCLPSDTRRYYHNLRLFHKIPLLPGCRHPHNLTASISAVLEAIGTKHLELPADYKYAINEPNKRKARTIMERSKRTYGNHEHIPYIQREWRALPHISKFTQQDVDYCLRLDNIQHLGDLAQEAVLLNPSLTIPSTVQLPTTTPVSDDPPARSRPHIELVPQPANKPKSEPTSSTYYYKGRDVTKYVMEAVTLHYSSDKLTFPQLQSLADRAQLPLYMLRRLATREYVRRLEQEQ